MMAVTVSVEEATGNIAWPDVPGLVGVPTATVRTAWRRIETYIGWRWAERQVVFITEGRGEWTPPLRPFLVQEVQHEELGIYTPQPLSFDGGLVLEMGGRHKITCVIGDPEAPPDEVKEAVRRLALYLAHNDGSLGGFKTESLEGVGTFEQFGPNTAARSLQYSGAADLLRAWRNLGRC